MRKLLAIFWTLTEKLYLSASLMIVATVLTTVTMITIYKPPSEITIATATVATAFILSILLLMYVKKKADKLEQQRKG